MQNMKALLYCYMKQILSQNQKYLEIMLEEPWFQMSDIKEKPLDLFLSSLIQVNASCLSLNGSMLWTGPFSSLCTGRPALNFF